MDLRSLAAQLLGVQQTQDAERQAVQDALDLSPVLPVQQGGNRQLIIGQTGADPAYTTLGGDATLDNAGALTIANAAVTRAKLDSANLRYLSLRTEGQAPGNAEVALTQGPSLTRYWQLGGQAVGVINAAEANVARTVVKARTVREVIIYVSANGLTAACTATLRKTGADTAMTAIIGIGATGAITLTGGPITFAAGDTWDLKLVTIAGGTTISILAIEVVYTE